MNTAKSIIALNKFLCFHNERFENYEINILETNEQDIKNLLNKFQEKCFDCKSELINEITKLGGNPIQDSVTSKKFLHFWLDIKHVFVHTNREDLLQICEYNEFLNIKRFTEILDKNVQFLNYRQNQMLNKQLILLQENHDYLQTIGKKLELKQNDSNVNKNKIENQPTF